MCTVTITVGKSLPVQLHELPACISHMVHLQVGGSAEHPWHHAQGQGKAGGVHEVQQQRDAGGIQGVGEGDGHELLLLLLLLPNGAAAALVKQEPVGIQRVEEATERRRGEKVVQMWSDFGF